MFCACKYPGSIQNLLRTPCPPQSTRSLGTTRAMPFLQGAQFVLAVVLLTGMECARSLRSFVPKNLFEFFRVVANCYFLLISVLQVRFFVCRYFLPFPSLRFWCVRTCVVVGFVSGRHKFKPHESLHDHHATDRCADHHDDQARD
jgi:hypothetical protein